MEKGYSNVLVTIDELGIKRKGASRVIRGNNHTNRTHIWWETHGRGDPHTEPDVDVPSEKVIIEGRPL